MWKYPKKYWEDNNSCNWIFCVYVDQVVLAPWFEYGSFLSVAYSRSPNKIINFNTNKRQSILALEIFPRKTQSQESVIFGTQDVCFVMEKSHLQLD